MEMDKVALGLRLKEARKLAGLNQEDLAEGAGMTQPVYNRVEKGTRDLRGDELIRLADQLGIRASALTGLTHVRERARFAARTDGTATQMTAMRDKLYAYLELDSYLTDQGIAGA